MKNKEREYYEAEISKYDECINRLEEDIKDLGGELELWQRENAELKTQIKKMKNCLNCKQCTVSESWHLYCDISDRVKQFKDGECEHWEMRK